MASLPTSSKPSRSKGKSRRGVVKTQESLGDRFARFAQHPSAGWGLITALVFVIAAAAIVARARELPQLESTRTARDTRVVRIEFDKPNAQQTRQQRENARQNTPRVYRMIGSSLDAIIGDVQRLPASAAIASMSEPDQGEPSDPVRFVRSLRLPDEQREAIERIGSSAELRTEWAATTSLFRDILERNPLLNQADWNRAVSEGLSRNLELVTPSGSRIEQREQAINIDDDSAFTDQVSRLIRSAAFPADTSDALLTLLKQRAAPTFAYDASLNDERQEAAVSKVQPVVDKRAVGQKIFTKGDVLTPAQVTLYEQELVEYRNRAPASRLWSARLGIAGVVAGTTAAFGFVLVALAPWTVNTPRRVVRLAALIAITLLISSVCTIAAPASLPLSSTAPVALLTVLMVTVYNRLTAGIVGLFTAMLVSFALTPPHHYIAINAAGIAAVLWCLPEIRDRGSLVRMSLWLSLSIGLATAVDRLSALPLDATRIHEILIVSAFAGMSGLAVGCVIVFILPGVEQVFNITTGMTLVELRDPKRELLKQLQQKAPGTYNHSLNVATIAESAAAAIDADALLTYAGALYHDIGKMTKPEYFVENQGGGVNRHDRLSPAMSVLVIIGHVKDGLELARQYNLPRPLHHFIEAHHGTTLVEYFYHRAKQNAEDGEEDNTPEEFDFRYPGPKPKTKEAAILMLADSVESATRTLREPTPSRIESLVEQIASKRLMDGQFDQCDLTLGELHKVCQSISKTLASIYHGRVQYPGDKKEKPEKSPDTDEESPPEAREKTA